jgi:hypothetical protein
MSGNQKTYPHYFKKVPLDPETGQPVTHVDVYAVCRMFGVTSAPVSHAIKKLLCPGQRGAKDRLTDIREAAKTLQREIELEDADQHPALRVVPVEPEPFHAKSARRRGQD